MSTEQYNRAICYVRSGGDNVIETAGPHAHVYTHTINILKWGCPLTVGNPVKIQRCMQDTPHPLIQEHFANWLIQTNTPNMPLTIPHLCTILFWTQWSTPVIIGLSHRCRDWDPGPGAYKCILPYLITASFIYMGKIQEKRLFSSGSQSTWAGALLWNCINLILSVLTFLSSA